MILSGLRNMQSGSMTMMICSEMCGFNNGLLHVLGSECPGNAIQVLKSGHGGASLQALEHAGLRPAIQQSADGQEGRAYVLRRLGVFQPVDDGGRLVVGLR